jgi:hypothetical protein
MRYIIALVAAFAFAAFWAGGSIKIIQKQQAHTLAYVESIK